MDNEKKLNEYLRLKREKLKYLYNQQKLAMQNQQQLTTGLTSTVNATNDSKRQPHQRLQYGTTTNWDDDDEEEEDNDDDDDEEDDDDDPNSIEILNHLKN